ncbi:MAG: ribosome small subunit-dependent GTPase A [Gallionellales bacterium GWA2_55_18]|nr:MAG: ribosome small subunit-dependent GTPase A [Gallionellales bacterium GWA2_55_18]
MTEIIQGQVIAAFGRQYLVRMADGSEIACLTRGKKSAVVCGDMVEIKLTGEASAENDAQGVIERIAPRRSLLHRSETFREKLIAANVTQIIVVLAAEPSFDDGLLARCLVAAHDQQLDALIVLNKCDLHDAAAAARKRLKPYRAIGYRVLELSAKQNVSQLRPLLQGHTSVLVGQSGMGKSTIINALLPDAQAATREISSALDSGKHTTTHARLYRIDDSSSMIDCPGVQAFGLHHLSFGGIEEGFVEFAKYRGQCRFYDCRHLHEPGCALQHAVEAEEIDARRLELFRQITAK